VGAACHTAPERPTASPRTPAIPVVRDPACTRPALADARVSLETFHTPTSLAGPSASQSRAGSPSRATVGGCIPANRLIEVRCGRRLDPLITVGSGRTAHVFLGGRFAVRVDAAPVDATVAGVSRDLRVYRRPGDPRWLYVETEGVVARWLALPPATRVATPPTTFMIGDSILDGAKPYVGPALRGWTVGVDAQIGRPSITGVAIAAAHAATPPDASVVELGTNDADPAAFRTHAAAILSSLSASPLILWVNVHSPVASAPSIDREIRLATAAYPNAAIADWRASAPKDELSSDGIHLAPGHEGAFATFLGPLLRSWHQAVEGEGPARCLATVAAATP
jgi:hypothetical protein